MQSVTILWIILGSIMIFLISSFILHRYLKRLPKKEQPKPFERLTFYISLLLNIPLSGIAIYSLVIAQDSLKIAQDAYVDAQKSGPAQQAALDGSRKALESVIQISSAQKKAIDSSTSKLGKVVESTIEQQKLLAQNLKVSSTQLSLIQQQHRLLLLKPKLEFEINDNTEYLLRKNTIEIREVYKLSDKVLIRIKVCLRNTGDALAPKPVIGVSTSKNIMIRNLDAFSNDGGSAGWITKYQNIDLKAYRDYQEQIEETLNIEIPTSERQFSVVFKAACVGIPYHELIVKFRLAN